MKIDLHNHTIHSDGILSEEELVKRAKLNGVDIFALTDHDSTYGCENIIKYGEKYGVKVIKGMELSTDYYGESIHIVCLFKDNIIPEKILNFSRDFKEKRKLRAIKMIELIHEYYGLKYDLDLLLEGEVITRANIMRNIAKCNNISFEEAKKYCSKDSKAYIPSTKMSVSEGLDLAHQAGSIAIFAHPCLVKNRSIVEDLIKLGFDGIEVRYPSNKNDESYFLNLAKKYNLFISAGSDCHGDNTHADIGTSTLNEEEFRPLAKALNFKI